MAFIKKTASICLTFRRTQLLLQAALVYPPRSRMSLAKCGAFAARLPCIGSTQDTALALANCGSGVA